MKNLPLSVEMLDTNHLSLSWKHTRKGNKNLFSSLKLAEEPSSKSIEIIKQPT
uniref:LRR-RLK n=1 Tax=Rhizophora mucronata TaxID=61149 RepID=A0A2P2LT99_RHIMU